MAITDTAFLSTFPLEQRWQKKQLAFHTWRKQLKTWNKGKQQAKPTECVWEKRDTLP